MMKVNVNGQGNLDKSVALLRTSRQRVVVRNSYQYDDSCNRLPEGLQRLWLEPVVDDSTFAFREEAYFGQTGAGR